MGGTNEQDWVLFVRSFLFHSPFHSIAHSDHVAITISAVVIYCFVGAWNTVGRCRIPLPPLDHPQVMLAVHTNCLPFNWCWWVAGHISGRPVLRSTGFTSFERWAFSGGERLQKDVVDLFQFSPTEPVVPFVRVGCVGSYLNRSDILFDDACILLHIACRYYRPYTVPT